MKKELLNVTKKEARELCWPSKGHHTLVNTILEGKVGNEKRAFGSNETRGN